MYPHPTNRMRRYQLPRDAHPERPVSIVSLHDLQIYGVSTEDLIQRLIDIDYDVLEGAHEEEVGLVERWKPIVENNPDGMRVAVTPDLSVIGYWHFLPLDDISFEKVKEGIFDDRLVTIDQLKLLGPPGEYNLYFMVIAILPNYRGAKLMRMLLNAFVDTLLDLSNQEVFFPEMCAWALSPEGNAMCRNLKMANIADHHKRGKIYQLDLRRCPNQLFYRKQLRQAYQNVYGSQ